MPIYSPPSTDQQRLLFLQQALATTQQDHTRGNFYVTTETLTALQAFLPTVETAVSQVATTLSGRSQEVQQQQAALNQLETYVRDFWEGVRRRTKRLGHPAGVLPLYGLPLDGQTPAHSSSKSWLSFAEQIVQGETQAVAQEYLAMANPSAAEVGTALAQARGEVEDVSAADRAYDEAQEVAAELRFQANTLIGDVMAELRFHLRQQLLPSQRRIMRTYGATFEYLVGEPLEADDVSPPQPATPPPTAAGDE